MATVVIDGVSKDLSDGSPIKETCQKLGVPFGCEAGSCATCVIVVEDGMENLSPLNELERSMRLSPMERLACQAIIQNGTVRATW